MAYVMDHVKQASNYSNLIYVYLHKNDNKNNYYYHIWNITGKRLIKLQSHVCKAC